MTETQLDIYGGEVDWQEAYGGKALALPPQPVEVLIERQCHFKKKPDENGKRRLGCARCGLAKMHPDHFGAPPSLNMLGSGNQHAYRALKEQWQAILFDKFTQAGLTPASRFVVEGEACFPDRGRKDQGNFRALLEKALGDTLTMGKWLEDDDWSRYEFGNLSYRYEKGRSYTRLVLFPS